MNSKEVDLTEYDMTNIVGYVPQNSFLINDTILNNIALGEFENKINLDKVHETIKETYLEPLIKNLKNGIYTDVGENGIKLSGGQKQRLCIARALRQCMRLTHRRMCDPQEEHDRLYHRK